MTKFIRNSNVVELSCKIKTYEFAEEATRVGINEAMEVYIQLYFKRYKGKLVMGVWKMKVVCVYIYKTRPEIYSVLKFPDFVWIGTQCLHYLH